MLGMGIQGRNGGTISDALVLQYLETKGLKRTLATFKAETGLVWFDQHRFLSAFINDFDPAYTVNVTSKNVAILEILVDTFKPRNEPKNHGTTQPHFNCTAKLPPERLAPVRSLKERPVLLQEPRMRSSIQSERKGMAGNVSRTANTMSNSYALFQTDWSGSHPHRNNGGSPGRTTPVEPLEEPFDWSPAEECKLSPGGTRRTKNSGTAAAVSGYENLLAIKQNMLAQMSLTPEENFARQEVVSSPEDCSPEEEREKRQRHKGDNNNDSKSTTMVLCDIEDEDFDFEKNSPLDNKGRKPCELLSIRKPIIDGRPVLKTIDAQTWRDLKNVVVGPNGILQEGWLGQGFNLDSNLLYGLVQKRGGPCGVLAAVQALVVRNLIFGSPMCTDDDELPVPDVSMLFSTDPAAMRTLTFRRTRALVSALAEILWRCGKISNKQNHGQNERKTASTLGLWDFTIVQNDELEDGEGGSEAVVCFSGANIGDDLRIFDRFVHLQNYIHGNIQKFDCVSLVYSAVLSRGIQQVQDDFDFPNSPLLGSHGYCSQELVNLLTTGKAISNVFDNQITLDDKILKGIESRCDVGLLSLFEHYDSCQVGNYLKSPKFPIWIVCSESHFSVLFATNPNVAREDESETLEKFDLFYYDGLARQQNHIRLVIELADGQQKSNPQQRFRTQAGSSASSFTNINRNSNNNNNGSDGDEDMVPPLEKCIRTKWKKARVDWNDTEPIL